MFSFGAVRRNHSITSLLRRRKDLGSTMPSACCRFGIIAELGHDATRPARNSPFGVGLVDKLLRGAKPAEIRVEQASTYQQVINRKAVRQLDLGIPAAILIGADEVID